MNSNDGIVENIVDHVYGKYAALTSKDHIRNAVNTHLSGFIRSIVKSSVLFESACKIHSFQPTISPVSSSEEMWDEFEKSQFKSILSSNIHTQNA